MLVSSISRSITDIKICTITRSLKNHVRVFIDFFVIFVVFYKILMQLHKTASWLINKKDEEWSFKDRK